MAPGMRSAIPGRSSTRPRPSGWRGCSPRQELERARARDWDPRVAEALGHSREYGIAEYLAAGPQLLRDWEDARGAAAGRHARGAALVAAAIDLRRAGYTAPIPRAVLGQVQEQYLTGPEHGRTPREPLPEAWQWATRQRVTTALLQPVASDRVEVFDYLVDTVQRRTAPGAHVPERGHPCRRRRQRARRGHLPG